MSFYSIAQKTIVELYLPAHIKATSASLSPDNVRDEYQHEYNEDAWELMAPIAKGKAVLGPILPTPQFITLYVEKMPPARLFLTPGDHLILRYQEVNGKKSYTVTGEGSHNNQAVIERPLSTTLSFIRSRISQKCIPTLPGATTGTRAATICPATQR